MFCRFISMKTILILILSIMTSTAGDNSSDIVVQLNNLKQGKGSINVALFRTAEDFTDNPFKTLKQKVRTGQSGASVTFKNIEPGYYAIAVYQDVNDNGEFDTNFVGIPKEPYGFSNNYRPTVSSPSFDKAKFKLTGDKIVQQIKVE